MLWSYSLRVPDDEDRDAILKRRQRLVAIALSGLASASTGCYESHTTALPPTARDAGVDSGTVTPGPCLGAPLPEDAGFDSGVVMPGPCLSAPADDAGADAAPTPCLDIEPEDAGAEDAGDAGPTPCLTI